MRVLLTALSTRDLRVLKEVGKPRQAVKGAVNGGYDVQFFSTETE